MSDLAVRIDRLSKRYRLGGAVAPYKTLRETLAGLASAPWRAARRVFKGHVHRDRPPELWALRDVSFDIKKGEAVGIIGRNGAGKSTLLKILSRITEPTNGRIGLNGRIGSLLEVGTGFHPELTGRENIFLNGAILGMSRVDIRRKFDEIVEFAEVEKFLDTAVKHYSSGMYMRLAFAVAAHLEPEILVVDEVLAVGDAQFQKKCLGKMNEVAHAGRTILFVSHNMDAVRRLCTAGVWLQNGEVRFQGPAEECVSRYLVCGVQDGGRLELDPPLALPNHAPIAILAVEVSDRSGRTKQCFSASEPISVKICWRLHEPLYKPRIGFVIHSTIAGEVFTALDAESWTVERLQPGTFESSCTIPGHLLNEGSYVLDFTADVPNRFDFQRGLTGSLLGFDVQDDMTLPNKYYGQEGFRDSRWPGVILPNIPWIQKRID